ncbi:inactive hydroxysteroid dehydrogenase-like protein 1 [Macrobrachium nipponense]|uniref:inactive hydroxysteroid dehydrogenase-like protein 1 n=1 Tax=Macrobrachium nipponense TaxID=159736 RepID=UPI0030C86B7B
MAVACDSIEPLLQELVSNLRHVEEVLSFVGIYYIGKLTLSALYNVLDGMRIHVISKLFAPKLTQKYGQWAVLAGINGRIGEAFATEFARNGMNIVMLSNSLEEMKKITQKIGKEFGVETEVLQIDFCSGQPVYSNIYNSLNQKDIGILVNDCRKLVPDTNNLENISDDDLWGMVHANIGAVPAMAKIVLPGMKERKRGAIINISSIEGCSLFPFRHINPATEAFVNSFSRALDYECRFSGITIQTLLMGPVSFSADKKQLSSFISSIFIPPASTYAYHAVSTIGYSQITTGYWVHGVLVWLLKRIPESLLIWSYVLAFNFKHYQKID